MGCNAIILKFLKFIIIILGFGSITLVVSQAKQKVIAVVNDKEIILADIESFSPSQHLALDEHQLYALRRVALENYIIHILLKKEAERKKIPVASLRKSMTLGKVEISNDKVEKEYVKNTPYFASMSPDEAKERLRLDLEGEARIQLYLNALSKLKSKAKIKIFLKEPPPISINKSDKKYPFRGDKDAKITIIEFSDFRCPHCKISQQTIKRLLIEYKGKIKFVYKNLPLQTNRKWLVPAIAAHCANSQGYFWEFHNSLFNSDSLSINLIRKLAIEKGLDLEEFETCFVSENSRFAVLSDLKEAKELGITSTPTFIVNGKVYVGRLDLTTFKSIIERELILIKRNAKDQ